MVSCVDTSCFAPDIFSSFLIRRFPSPLASLSPGFLLNQIQLPNSPAFPPSASVALLSGGSQRYEDAKLLPDFCCRVCYMGLDQMPPGKKMKVVSPADSTRG
jgi:hypothetical protein